MKVAIVRRVALGLGWAGLLLSGSACVSMPSQGPVVVEGAVDTESAPPGIYFDPPPPRNGQSAEEVVAGFLEAMKAMPIRTSVAAQYLTEAERDRWAPQSATWTYAEFTPPTGDATVRLPLREVNRYRSNGAWAASTSRERVVFELTMEGGQWRIDEAPDALMVPESWFADWYRRASLYYFDPSFRTLVAEPVYVPAGEQLATSLVRGLVTARVGQRRRVTRTAFPEGLQAPLAVPVSESGVVEVALEAGPVADDTTRQRMLAQVAATLSQDPSLRTLRFLINDTPEATAEGGIEVSLDGTTAIDPFMESGSPDVFGLRRGRLVSGPLEAMSPTDGPFGIRRLGVRSVGVNLTGERAAGVSDEGEAVLVGPVEDPDGAAVRVLSAAVDLLRPQWDGYDVVWLVDRNRGAATIRAVSGRRTARTVVVPGISGRRVTRFLVSRDGTRLVAVVRSARGDRVWSARLLRGVDGEVISAGRAVRIGISEEPTRVQDIGWRTPTAVSVLSRITDDLAQVRTVPVEGAPGDLTTPGTLRVRGEARRLLMSPVQGQGAYVVTAGALVDLTQPTRDPLDAQAVGLVFVG